MKKQEGRGVLHPLWPRSELPMTLGVVGGGSGPSSVSGSCVYSDKKLLGAPSQLSCPPRTLFHLFLKEATLQGGFLSVSRFELGAAGWTRIAGVYLAGSIRPDPRYPHLIGGGQTSDLTWFLEESGQAPGDWEASRS